MTFGKLSRRVIRRLEKRSDPRSFLVNFYETWIFETVAAEG